MDENKSKVYIQTDESGIITACEGGYTSSNIRDVADWILIDEGEGDRYNLCQTHYFEGGIYDYLWRPRWRWDGEKAVRA